MWSHKFLPSFGCVQILFIIPHFRFLYIRRKVSCLINTSVTLFPHQLAFSDMTGNCEFDQSIFFTNGCPPANSDDPDAAMRNMSTIMSSAGQMKEQKTQGPGNSMGCRQAASSFSLHHNPPPQTITHITPPPPVLIQWVAVKLLPPFLIHNPPHHKTHNPPSGPVSTSSHTN